MSTQQSKIIQLLQRYSFVDFAQVIALPEGSRKEHLRRYINRERKGRWKTYTGFKSMVPDIVGVQRGLDLTSSLSKDEIHRGLKLRCHKDDLGFNIVAANALFDFVRPRDMVPYADHHRRDLHIAPDRKISMEIFHYAVARGKGAFQFVYPRRDRLLGHIPDILMSIVYHNYVDGDFEDFGVEMVDLSVEPTIGPKGGIRTTGARSPRLLSLAPENLRSRTQLNDDANSVYELLMELSAEQP